MNLLRIFDRHPRADISAYADGELGRQDGERLERHLESCAACRDELAELRALRSALSDLPEVRVPRSFALTPEQVAEPAPARPAPRTSPAFVAMRVTGAGVAAILAVVIFFDSGGIDTSTTSTSNEDAAPAAESAGDRSTLGDQVPVNTQSGVEIDSGDDADHETPPSAPGDAGGSDGSIGGGNDTNATAVPAQSGSADYGLTGEDNEKSVDDSSGESAPAIVATSGQAESSASNDNDGISTLLAIEIALGVIAVAALGGSFVLPRLRRDN